MPAPSPKISLRFGKVASSPGSRLPDQRIIDRRLVADLRPVADLVLRQQFGRAAAASAPSPPGSNGTGSPSRTLSLPPRLQEALPKIGNTTRSPGRMPSRAAVPPLSFEHGAGRRGGGDRVERLRHGPLGDVDDAAPGVDEQHVERDEVFFIHIDDQRRRLEVEQHAGIGRQATAEHQPLFELRRGRRQLDMEFVRPVGALDRQLAGRKTLQLLCEGSGGGGEEQQQREERAEEGGHGASYRTDRPAQPSSMSRPAAA